MGLNIRILFKELALLGHVDVAPRDMVSWALASVGLMAALNDLNVLFQPKQFYDSMVHCSFFFFSHS